MRLFGVGELLLFQLLSFAGSITLSEDNLHVFILVDVIVKLGRGREIAQLSIEEVPDDLSRRCVHIRDSSRSQKASFPRNLPQELIYSFKGSDSVVLDQLRMLNAIQQGFYRTIGIVDFFHSYS